MKWQPMRDRVWWVLLYPSGVWWCEKPIRDHKLAERTAASWNKKFPDDPLRVQKIRLIEKRK